jgi:hypothetical protein
MRRFRAHEDSLTTRIGEKFMQSHTKQTQARRRAPLQIDLFAGDPQKAIGDMPVWSGLPMEIKAALTCLITRLLVEHADKSRIGSVMEAGHDH